MRTRSVQRERGAIAALDDEEMTQALERVALLVPWVSDGSRDPITYGLAYVERYHGDVLQLEHERRFLTATLMRAWLRGDDQAVILLAAGLAHIAHRFESAAEAERVLRLGIEAARRVGNVWQAARLATRLGGVLFARGEYQQGWRLWAAGMSAAEAPGVATTLWEPLSSFAHIADLIGTFASAEDFVRSLEGRCEECDAASIAVARFIRGFYARLTHRWDSAYDDLSRSIQLLSSQAPASDPPSTRQLFLTVAQVELARVLGDYTRSQSLAGASLALAHTFSDHYTVAALLLDQTLYTYGQGRIADTQAALPHLREVARQMEAPHARRVVRFWDSRLFFGRTQRAISAPADGASASPEDHASAAPTPSLTEREADVLGLVAAGLSNQEIAVRLVVTHATAKKHLEHIYSKLGVHSRTAAVAYARSFKLIP
jgi:DNA-binding CsgD family transcriptional regulator